MGGVELHLHTFLNSSLGWGEWSASRSDPFRSGIRILSFHWLLGLVDPTAVLEAVGKISVSTKLMIAVKLTVKYMYNHLFSGW